MSKRIAVYAGTFDPLTLGHLWMVQRGSSLFGELVVAIGANPDKRCKFPLEDRLAMLREATKIFPNVRVDSFPYQYLVEYAKDIDARFILRGIRTVADYEYERGMRNINGDINPSITTVFLMPDREVTEVSSSLVRGLVGPEGWEQIVRRYVPQSVFEKILEAWNAR